MQRFINNQKGHIFFFVLITMIFISFLGLSLMALTMNGNVRNESRNNTVYAEDLADKGIDFIIKDIQKALKDEISKNNYTRNDFKILLENMLNQYKCPKEITIAGEQGGTTTACIKKIELVSTEEKDAYKRLVTFMSKGEINGKERTVETKAVIGTDAVPDQLKYAVSTNNGGNLFLHGGVEIQGDIRTDGHLILSNLAVWHTVEGNNIDNIKEVHWVDSVYPKMIKTSNSFAPKIILRENNNIYISKLPKTTNVNGYNQHIQGKNLNNSSYYQKIEPNTLYASKQLSNILFESPDVKIVTKILPDDTVDVSGIVQEKLNENINRYDQLTISKNDNNNNPLKNLQKQDEVLIARKTCDKKGCSYNKSTLKIDANRNDIHLKGTLYVYGDLIIENTNLKSDALLFVEGNVRIRESTLSGIQEQNTLIIFATGNIHISNISVDQDKPSKIKGFFYTKSDMIMYGVGSNIELHGGISTRRLILTAVRGSSNKHQYDSVEVQKKKNSRLKIIYDENLISEYVNFNREEEENFIKELNDPEIIERKY